MALLKEPKDKLTLPYELFAESGTHLLDFIDLKNVMPKFTFGFTNNMMILACVLFLI